MAHRINRNSSLLSLRRWVISRIISYITPFIGDYNPRYPFLGVIFGLHLYITGSGPPPLFHNPGTILVTGPQATHSKVLERPGGCQFWCPKKHLAYQFQRGECSRSSPHLFFCKGPGNGAGWVWWLVFRVGNCPPKKGQETWNMNLVE